jgi:hypothetical protein
VTRYSLGEGSSTQKTHHSTITSPTEQCHANTTIYPNTGNHNHKHTQNAHIHTHTHTHTHTPKDRTTRYNRKAYRHIHTPTYKQPHRCTKQTHMPWTDRHIYKRTTHIGKQGTRDMETNRYTSHIHIHARTYTHEHKYTSTGEYSRMTPKGGTPKRSKIDTNAPR